MASIVSLAKQGGPMSDEEAVEYRKKPYFTECLLLRRWDDHGKLDIDSDEIPEQVWTDIHTVLAAFKIS
jgi:predicted HD phosphohydrolase